MPFCDTAETNIGQSQKSGSIQNMQFLAWPPGGEAKKTLFKFPTLRAKITKFTAWDGERDWGRCPFAWYHCMGGILQPRTLGKTRWTLSSSKMQSMIKWCGLCCITWVYFPVLNLAKPNSFVVVLYSCVSKSKRTSTCQRNFTCFRLFMCSFLVVLYRFF